MELDRVVLDVLGEARHLVHGQQLNLDTIEPVQVVGDPDRLKQLTLILLDNAIKYTPESGSVSVSLRRSDHAAVLKVHDTGTGISQKDLPRVFERFYRADPARGRDAGGTGLGSSIARWNADQHGADIRLSSQPERGTRALSNSPYPRDILATGEGLRRQILSQLSAGNQLFLRTGPTLLVTEAARAGTWH